MMIQIWIPLHLWCTWLLLLLRLSNFCSANFPPLLEIRPCPLPSCSHPSASVGGSGLVVQYWTHYFTSQAQILTESFASSLEQAVSLQRAQANSASYPWWDMKWVVAYGLWGEGLVWVIGVAVCLCAAPWAQFFAIVDNEWPHNEPRYH